MAMSMHPHLTGSLPAAPVASADSAASGCCPGCHCGATSGYSTAAYYSKSYQQNHQYYHQPSTVYDQPHFTATSGGWPPTESSNGYNAAGGTGSDYSNRSTSEPFTAGYGQNGGYLAPPTPTPTSSDHSYPPSVGGASAGGGGATTPSLPSDHYPPTPYSVDLNSPNSDNSIAYNTYGYESYSPHEIPDTALQDLIGETTDLLESISKDNGNNGNSTAGNQQSTINPESPSHETSSVPSVYSTESQSEKESSDENGVDLAVTAVSSASDGSETSETESEPEMPRLSIEAPLPLPSPPAHRIRKRPTKPRNFRTHNNYSAKELQETLDSACSDLFHIGEPNFRVPGYPLDRLMPEISENPENPGRESTNVRGGKLIRLVFRDNKKSRDGPPKITPETGDCLSAAKTRTDKNSRYKSISISRHGESHQQESESAYTYQCSGCLNTWPLTSVQQIYEHFSSACRSRGTAQLTRAARAQFSAFFKHFSYRVRMLVNPLTKRVTSKTVVICNACTGDTEFDLHASRDLAGNLNDHLVKEHPEIQDVLEANSATKSTAAAQVKGAAQLCYFCDRRVNDLARHMQQYEAIHSERIIAMAPCFHSKTEGEDDDFDESADEFQTECKHCGDLYSLEKRLPDWLSRAGCNSCLVALSEKKMATTSKQTAVVICQLCRQGKFGRVNQSACEECAQRVRSFRQLTDPAAGRAYVTGMLNDLVSFFLLFYSHAPLE